MLNIEFKAELRDPNLARSILTELGATRVGTLEQTDTYYRVVTGRLKRRDQRLDAEAPTTEFVFYERPDHLGFKASTYHLYTEAEAETKYGQSMLPVWLVVRKRRELWTADNVRVHLDDVEDLGRFFELEAPVGAVEQPARDACTRLRRALAPALGEPIADSYADLMRRTLENDPGG